MQKRQIEILTSRLDEILDTISGEDYISWRANPLTKALELKLKVDSEAVKDNWANGDYHENDKQLKAQGKAEYIEGLIDSLDTAKGDFEDAIS